MAISIKNWIARKIAKTFNGTIYKITLGAVVKHTSLNKDSYDYLLHMGCSSRTKRLSKALFSLFLRGRNREIAARVIEYEYSRLERNFITDLFYNSIKNQP